MPDVFIPADWIAFCLHGPIFALTTGVLAIALIYWELYAEYEVCSLVKMV